MKKLISILVIVLFIIVPVYADEPSDWALEFIDYLKADSDYDTRLLSDYQSPITRKDFAYIGVKVYEAITGEACITGDAYFNDSDDSYVLKAKNHGIVGGYGNGLYGPDDYITRQDLAVLFNNVLNMSRVSYVQPTSYTFADDSLIASYAKSSIYTTYSNNIISGVGHDKFDPLGFATREQAIVMLSKVQTQFEDKEIYISNNRHYDWYIDQEHTGDANNNNCGPASAVMAAKFQNQALKTTAEEARNLYPKDNGWWSTGDISNFFTLNNIDNEIDDFDGYHEIKATIDQGDIVLVCIDTTYISANDQLNDQTGRFYGYQGGHFLVIKGYKKIDGNFYFEVYDPNNWSELQENGTEKGLDRYYLESDLSKAIQVWWPYYFIIKK